MRALAVAVVTASCKDPTGFHNDSLPPPAPPVQADGDAGAPNGPPPLPENCPASPEWFPVTPSLEALGRMFEPLPHPNTECPFYRGGLQTFLIATQPDPNTGEPALVTYPTIDDVFQKTTPLPDGALAPPGAHRGTAQRAWLGTIKQAGFRQILIDQNGHTIYYGIHLNQGFVDFVNEYGLQTLTGVKNADPRLFFPAGVVEYKSAWMDIDPNDGVTGDFSNYITTTAWVATLSQDPVTKLITEDLNKPRQIKVALIAIHAVYTLPGHPEFIWASIQHVNYGGGDQSSNQGSEVGVTPNSAPAFQDNPSDSDPDNQHVSTPAATSGDYLLYKSGTAANLANQAILESKLVLDATHQVFHNLDNSIAQTSIYRQFPGSKSNDVHPDDAVTSLNSNYGALVAQYPNDLRRNYRVVAAVWMDKPALFTLNVSLQIEASPLYSLSSMNDEAAFASVSQDDVGFDGSPGRKQLLSSGVTPAQDVQQNGSDSPFSILGGENRLSSTAMESFTQSTNAFSNCFSCHDTQAVTDHGVPVDRDSNGKVLLEPKLINVSHVFSEFVRDECLTNPTEKLCN